MSSYANLTGKVAIVTGGGRGIGGAARIDVNGGRGGVERDALAQRGRRAGVSECAGGGGGVADVDLGGAGHRADVVYAERARADVRGTQVRASGGTGNGEDTRASLGEDVQSGAGSSDRSDVARNRGCPAAGARAEPRHHRQSEPPPSHVGTSSPAP